MLFCEFRPDGKGVGVIERRRLSPGQAVGQVRVVHSLPLLLLLGDAVFVSQVCEPGSASVFESQVSLPGHHEVA